MDLSGVRYLRTIILYIVKTSETIAINKVEEWISEGSKNGKEKNVVDKEQEMIECKKYKPSNEIVWELSDNDNDNVCNGNKDASL